MAQSLHIISHIRRSLPSQQLTARRQAFRVHRDTSVQTKRGAEMRALRQAVACKVERCDGGRWQRKLGGSSQLPSYCFLFYRRKFTTRETMFR